MFQELGILFNHLPKIEERLYNLETKAGNHVERLTLQHGNDASSIKVNSTQVISN